MRLHTFSFHIQLLPQNYCFFNQPSIYQDGNYILCEKCFKSGKYEKDKSADDFNFKLKDTVAAVWTEAETLLLLESALKHGDDWDLIAKNVQTKSRQECISKLIELPFGDLMLGAGNRKSEFLEASNELQEIVKAESPTPELQNKDRQIGDDKNEGPPLKRVCIERSSDVGSSLMKQVLLFWFTNFFIIP